MKKTTHICYNDFEQKENLICKKEKSNGGGFRDLLDKCMRKEYIDKLLVLTPIEKKLFGK